MEALRIKNMRPCIDGKIIFKWNLMKQEEGQDGLHSSHSGWGPPVNMVIKLWIS